MRQPLVALLQVRLGLLAADLRPPVQDPEGKVVGELSQERRLVFIKGVDRVGVDAHRPLDRAILRQQREADHGAIAVP